LCPYQVSSATPARTANTATSIRRRFDGIRPLSRISFRLRRHLKEDASSCGVHSDQPWRLSCQISKRNSATRATIRIMLPLSRPKRAAAKATSCAWVTSGSTWTIDDYKRRDKAEGVIALAFLVAVLVIAWFFTD
jgi:hypothetical protein